MNIIDAIRICFKKYIDCTGRASRSEFWYWHLFVLIMCSALDFMNEESAANGLYLLCLLPTISVTVRRCHDLGYKGFFWIIALTGIGYIMFIKAGDNKENQYGRTYIPEWKKID